MRFKSERFIHILIVNEILGFFCSNFGHPITTTKHSWPNIYEEK